MSAVSIRGIQIPGPLKAINARVKNEFHPSKLLFTEISKIDSCPADLAQKLIDQESVHAIADHQDLLSRLKEKEGRLCYTLTHPSMPSDPLAFVYVALVNQIPETIHYILDKEDLLRPSTSKTVASYYSITSPMKGLSGIDLGSTLIKRVLVDLQTRPTVNLYCTLSPIPGFKTWLESRLKTSPSGLLTDCECNELVNGRKDQDPLDVFLKHITSLSDKSPKIIESILMRLCYSYIFKEKRRRMALDKVSNFHVRNGAYILDRLRWRADLSKRGYLNSFGIMVNYMYFPSELEENSAAYLRDGTIKSISIEELEARLKKSKL